MSECGIDFSKNFTCLNIFDGEKINYISIYREKRFTKFQKKILEDLSQFENFNSIELKDIEASNIYSEKEINKIIDANIITNNIISIIKKFNVDNIIIEGFSFGSTGASAIDIGGYQYILRSEILKFTNNLKILSPKTIKKVAGGGNFSKEQMLESYLLNRNNDEILNKCQIYTYINSIRDQIVRKKNVLEPIAGLVDAYWVRKSINEK